jgi:hypothetical protein
MSAMVNVTGLEVLSSPYALLEIHMIAMSHESLTERGGLPAHLAHRADRDATGRAREHTSSAAGLVGAATARGHRAGRA